MYLSTDFIQPKKPVHLAARCRKITSRGCGASFQNGSCASLVISAPVATATPEKTMEHSKRVYCKPKGWIPIWRLRVLNFHADPTQRHAVLVGHQFLWGKQAHLQPQSFSFTDKKSELKQEQFSHYNWTWRIRGERENLVEKVTIRIQSLHWSIKIARRSGSCGRSSLSSSQCWIMSRKSAGLAATRACRATNVARRPKSWSTSSWECPVRRFRNRALPMRPEAKGLLSNTQIDRMIFLVFSNP